MFKICERLYSEQLSELQSSFTYNLSKAQVVFLKSSWVGKNVFGRRKSHRMFEEQEDIWYR